MVDNKSSTSSDVRTESVKAQTTEPPAPAPSSPPPPPVFPKGYNGKVLRVNLSDQSLKEEELDWLTCRKYLGGQGFITYFLWKELKPGVDPLGPDNKLIFALGPVSGYVLPGAARSGVGAKSPLNIGIAKAEAGGYWVAELKRAGYDVLIIEGKAAKPAYLWINDGKVEIKNAGHLWGKTTKETEIAIRAELGDEKIHVAMIGPAGENLVRYACIMHGCHDAAGRGGLGAVMGSKNLKAVAVRGHNLPAVANEEVVKEVRKELAAKSSPMSEYGTGGPELPGMEISGNLPVRNFRDGLFPQVKDISGVAMKDQGLRLKMDGCFACPVRCKKIIKAEEPYLIDPEYGGPEYETIAAFGSNCGIGDVKAICKANELCGAFGIDTISAGGSIAFAMECFEKGFITKKQTGGLDFKFGNVEALLKALDLINTRKGFGDFLAEGTARMAKVVGHGSEAFAMQVKGLEAGYHEPRLVTSLGLGYMTSPTGADHCDSFGGGRWNTDATISQLYPLGIYKTIPKDDMTANGVVFFTVGQLNSILNNSLIECIFVGFNPPLNVKLLSAITGWDITIGELFKTAERILTLTRLFNLREGLTTADDMLPERYFQPKTDGALSNKALNKEVMLKARSIYYSLLGWDASGVPTPERVAALSIE